MKALWSWLLELVDLDKMPTAEECARALTGAGLEVEALTHLGEGWVGDEAIALALYCVMKFPDDYVAVVRRGANTNARCAAPPR